MTNKQFDSIFGAHYVHFCLARREGRGCFFQCFAESRTSYRNGRNTEALIIENLEPVEITKKLFQHHLNILKNV